MTFVLGEQLQMKGRRRGPGWQYMGEDSRAFTLEQVDKLVDFFERNDYSNMITAAQTFRRTCYREGFISAINTWDRQILTWGVGFAHGTINEALWPRLSTEVKHELQFMAPDRFGENGVLRVSNADQSVRTDEAALTSLIHVAETEPFRESVFRAMFAVFTQGTLGIRLSNIQAGQRYALNNPSLVYFASRLAHWLPSGYQMRRDLPRTIQLAEMTTGSREARGTQFIAASLRVFSENFLRRYGVEREGGRHVLRESIGDNFNMVHKWQNRMAQYVRQDHPFQITPRVRVLVPSFTHANLPFFQIHSDWRQIPAGRLILSERLNNNRVSYIDVGPRH